MSNSKLRDYPAELLSRIGKKLYLNTELADVYFVFETSDKPAQSIPAHKTFLAAASDVFAAMFSGAWIEKNEVKITDVSVPVFKEFLQFFYFDRVTVTTENVAKVMKLGHMYDVAECLMVCDKLLKRNLDENNAVECYELAMLLEQETLLESCEKMIGYNAKAVFQSNDFLTCNAKTMSQIVKLNWLTCSEIELFEACMAWIKAGSKQDVVTKQMVEDQLGDSFYDIRFGSMTFNEFATLIPSYGEIFSRMEYQDIIQIIADKDFQSNMFNGIREQRSEINPWNRNIFPHLEDHILCRFLSLTSLYYISKMEKTVFSTSYPIFLHRIKRVSVYEYKDGQYHQPMTGMQSEVTIIEIKTSKTGEEIVMYRGKTTLYHAYLPKPILIRPGYQYEIRMKQNPTKKFCTKFLLKEEVKVNSDITIRFAACEENKGRGLIECLYFYVI
ncbi:uncharacterized protein LOC116351111 [Contarinia nasturtii]|uniref:uncharacterized protein LOC116351111 n=1 Tax=Contarinia nasturtii TaxID=265458 RepID=UPI0012D3C9FF|nr:uncharacterized protein LOC116351111 [Contarinia nasturtii]